jgi:hypothetical protein
MGLFVLLNAGLSMFAGGIGALVAFAIDRRMDDRPTQPPAEPQPLEAVCSCGHGYGKHRHDGCGGVTVVRREWTQDSSLNTWFEEQILECGCITYDGPDLETVRMLRGG